MAGNVYLRTNRFEVKLEGITFKTRDFEYLCDMDFLFPEGRVWDRPPVVGLDVMRHPRDPSILLVLLSFGVGCVILRFIAGKPLPPLIHKFLSDKRIHFVGFGIPEKEDLFPFKELGLTKSKVDIGYLAAKVLKQPKCKTWELAVLARKVLGIKRMVGLTEASSFERHEQIKCAICQLFMTSVIAMGLLRAGDHKKKSDGSHHHHHRMSSFLKNLNSLHLTQGWFKLRNKGKKQNQITGIEEEEANSIHVHIGEMEDMLEDDYLVRMSPFSSSRSSAKIQDKDTEYEGDSSVPADSGDGDLEEKDKRDDHKKDGSCKPKVPLKGILKCPSTRNMMQNCNSSPSEPESASTEKNQVPPRDALRRANSKGFNVSFKCQ